MIPAQYFDTFGLSAFIILFCISLKIIEEKKLKYYGYTILVISIIGLSVDSYNVLINFLLK